MELTLINDYDDCEMWDILQHVKKNLGFNLKKNERLILLEKYNYICDELKHGILFDDTNKHFWTWTISKTKEYLEKNYIDLIKLIEHTLKINW